MVTRASGIPMARSKSHSSSTSNFHDVDVRRSVPATIRPSAARSQPDAGRRAGSVCAAENGGRGPYAGHSCASIPSPSALRDHTRNCAGSRVGCSNGGDRAGHVNRVQYPADPAHVERNLKIGAVPPPATQGLQKGKQPVGQPKCMAISSAPLARPWRARLSFSWPTSQRAARGLMIRSVEQHGRQAEGPQADREPEPADRHFVCRHPCHLCGPGRERHSARRPRAISLLIGTARWRA